MAQSKETVENAALLKDGGLKFMPKNYPLFRPDGTVLTVSFLVGSGKVRGVLRNLRTRMWEDTGQATLQKLQGYLKDKKERGVSEEELTKGSEFIALLKECDSKTLRLDEQEQLLDNFQLAVFRAIVDRRDIKEEDLALIDSEDFWQEQDLAGVAEVSICFRKRNNCF